MVSDDHRARAVRNILFVTPSPGQFSPVIAIADGSGRAAHEHIRARWLRSAASLAFPAVTVIVALGVSVSGDALAAVTCTTTLGVTTCTGSQNSSFYPTAAQNQITFDGLTSINAG